VSCDLALLGQIAYATGGTRDSSPPAQKLRQTQNWTRFYNVLRPDNKHVDSATQRLDMCEIVATIVHEAVHAIGTTLGRQAA